MEKAIRAAGAIPATIGIGQGQVNVGMTAEELRHLAASPDIVKVNPGNLASTVASGRAGSTTVAATMAIASQAGIDVLATGGIGGVHRDVVETGDVSADLIALARFPVAVVCSGAKSVLDLPRTREALETLGVPVYGFATDRFPAFYGRDSGLSVDARFDDVRALAEAVHMHFRFGSGGVVVANPVPAKDALKAAIYENAIGRALADARREGVAGRDVTPFLLARLRDLTKGKSVETN